MREVKSELLDYRLTPMMALKRLGSMKNVLLLDSSRQHPALGRYSYLAGNPTSLWQVTKATQVPSTLEKFQQRLKKEGLRHNPELPPFQTGLAGLFSYNLAEVFENIPPSKINDLPMPYLAIGQYEWVIAWDHHLEKCWMLSHPDLKRDSIEKIRKLLETNPSNIKLPPFREVSLEAPKFPLPGVPGCFSNFDRESYLRTIQKAIDYIHAGDCFQVNISQRLHVPFFDSSWSLYQELREQNPSYCSAYFDGDHFVLASASPERFISLNEKRELESRPIKGTRPRHPDTVTDAKLAEELQRSAKDRAENVMIVDLLRNDLGRVSEYGSVQVPALCSLESNASVHHLVSVVRSKLREGLDAVDVLKATLPGGSITGAPKVRAMQIISELEPTCRGAYCGSLGFLSFTGTMDTSILIRTFTLAGGLAVFPVGGGIVADSDPVEEYNETLHKASGLFRTLAAMG